MVPLKQIIRHGFPVVNPFEQRLKVNGFILPKRVHLRPPPQSTARDMQHVQRHLPHGCIAKRCLERQPRNTVPEPLPLLRRPALHILPRRVQRLLANTVGGVVTPAQPLMVIVPKDNVLEVEAMLPNRDIGFVNPEQSAEVKVETFPFTKYGTIHGTITQVSSDAIQDEKLGLIYSTRVKLAKDTLRVENKTVRLSPGMAVTVEVKTGKRRVIEYFLSPLMQVTSESLRER